LINDVFFLLSNPIALQGNYRQISIDSSADVFDFDPDRPVTRYEADSIARSAAPRSAHNNPSVYPTHISREYLQLPPTDPRIPALAQQITANGHTPYEKAAELEGYLRSHFSYTLQLPSIIPDDPIANFLFERRQGHCEYFASSMAVMLRTLGIPSRVVNGFAGGEFNDISSEYVIRASEAHSWVEAFIPGQGWMEFDPTPASSLLPPQTNRFMLYMDAAASFWREWIVNYDLGHQLRLSQDASRGSRELVARAQAWMKRHYDRLLGHARTMQDRVGRSTVIWGQRVLVLFVIGLMIAAVPRALAFIRKLRLTKRPERAPQVAATLWYERMLHFVARQGWEKSPAQTPTEFLSVIKDDQLRASVARFTVRYENARFGNSAEEASHLPELFEEVKGTRSA
jgi:hypothetical protein